MNSLTILEKKNRVNIMRIFESDWWYVAVFSSVLMLLRTLISLMILLLILIPGVAEAQDAASPFHGNEQLQYKVKWSFIRLGTVTIRQTRIDHESPARYLLQMNVESAKGLPFINLHFVNQSILVEANPAVQRETITFVNDSIRTIYWRDSLTNFIIVHESDRGVVTRADSIRHPAPCYDALGLLMMARKLSGSGFNITLPTLNGYKVVPTDMVFTDDVEDIEIAAVATPVRSRRFEGNARWEGSSFGGMNGLFQGWVSDDPAAIIVRAEVKILLGSIVLELESYERRDWQEEELVHNASSRE